MALKRWKRKTIVSKVSRKWVPIWRASVCQNVLRIRSEITPYVNDLQTLNKFGSRFLTACRSLEKISVTFPSIFDKSLSPRWCQTCRVIQRQFCMKECDILGVETHSGTWNLLHIFRESRPQPQNLLPFVRLHDRRVTKIWNASFTWKLTATVQLEQTLE